jgi:hypothetical protein
LACGPAGGTRSKEVAVLAVAAAAGSWRLVAPAGPAINRL